MDILSYYRRLNWISAEVRDDLLMYMRGADEDADTETPELDQALQLIAGGPFDDHLPSLQYILNLSDESSESAAQVLQSVA